MIESLRRRPVTKKGRWEKAVVGWIAREEAAARLIGGNEREYKGKINKYKI